MLGKSQEGKSFGRISVADGWHEVEVQDGIDYVKNKEGNIVETDSGAKSWKFTFKVTKSSDESSIGGFISTTVFEGSNDKLATILASGGLWDIICEKFPGDISPFDKKVMEGVKSKFPGRPLMILSKQNKDGFANAEAFSSVKYFKEHIAPTLGSEAPEKPAAKKEEPAKGKKAASEDDWS